MLNKEVEHQVKDSRLIFVPLNTMHCSRKCTTMSMQMRTLNKPLLHNLSIETKLSTPDMLLKHSHNFTSKNRQIKYIPSYYSSTGILSCSCELAGSQQSTKSYLQTLFEMQTRSEEQLGPISTADVRCHKVEAVLHK